MAVTIRTGANGSYKSAYAVWFVILPALKEGRTVVTNLEGMEPLHIISERLGIEFPKSTTLIRLFSRDEKGLELWRYFYCWCPLNAQIVIDECQDIYSPKVGFKMEKYGPRPLSDFLDLLPDGYEDFFNSRHVPADMTKLRESEIDDRGRAEYDESGRIIYPQNFNEGFMRHRKYNWDIELLSPDYKQIDSGIKACAEQAFFHKSRDGFPFCKRKPYIFKHDKTATSVKIPEKKDPNLFTQKVPLDVHLLYKSTGTGVITKAGGMNTLFRDWKFWGACLMAVVSIGWFLHGVSGLVFGDEEEASQAEISSGDFERDQTVISQNRQSSSDVYRSRSDDSISRNGNPGGVTLVTKPSFFGVEGLKTIYFTGYIAQFKNPHDVKTSISLSGETMDGRTFSLNDRYLKYMNIRFKVIDECLLELTHLNQKVLISCPPSSNQDSLSVQSHDDAKLNVL